MGIKRALILLLVLVFIPGASSSHAVTSGYLGVAIFPRPFVGTNDTFILIRAYSASASPITNYPEVNLTIREELIPDYVYLFYVNSSGAYLVYEAMLPDWLPPGQMPPAVGYHNGSWYLFLDHSAVTFNVTPPGTGLHGVVGLYRFNKSCLSPTTLFMYDVVPAEDTWASPMGDGKYVEFSSTQESSMRFYFKVPKSILDKYLGPNTTADGVTAYSLIGGDTLVILPVEGALKSANGSKYLLIKPTRWDSNTSEYLYSVVINSSNEDDLPYYGALFYDKNGSVRFVPLLKYDPESPAMLSPSPNVKPFHVPFCSAGGGTASTTRPSGNPKNGTITLVILMAFLLAVPRVFLWRRGRRR